MARFPTIKLPFLGNRRQQVQPPTSAKPSLLIYKDGRLEKATLADVQAARVPISAQFGVDTWANPVYGTFMATSTPVYRAITVRSRAVAAAPLSVYRRRQNDLPELVGENHPVQKLLDKANPWWTSGDLIQATETYLCLWGSAFWYLEYRESPRAQRGQMPVAIWALRPDMMRIVPGTKQGQPYIVGYELDQGGRKVPFLPEEIIWFRYFNPLDEYAGLSPVAPGRQTFEMGRNAIQFNAAFFKNGAIPNDIIFMAQGPLQEEEVDAFYRRLEKRFGGSKNAHRPMLWDLSVGGKPERLGLSQKDMEFLSTLDFTVEEAARLWGVPPPMMYSQKQATYNNVKEARIEFYTSTVSQEWAFLEMEINEMLIPLTNDPDLFIQFDKSQVLPLQEAMADMDTRELEKVKIGAITINEFRKTRNLPPLPWGDAWWAPITALPITEDGLPGGTSATAGGQPPSNGSGASRSKAYTPEQLKAVSQEFDKALTAREKRFALILHDLFKRQEVDVLRRLRSLSTGKAIVIKQAPGDLFDPKDWLDIMVGEGKPLLRALLTAAANSQAQQFHLPGFDPLHPEILKWLDQRAVWWANQVNDETARLLAQELKDAMVGGESIPQIQERVQRVFAFNDVVRSERIARTETLAASNKGHLAIYEQSGVVESKQWLAKLDDRTRDAHIEANGQTVPLKQTFFVGGESLEAPGVGGSPEQVINCRCTVVPIISEAKLFKPAENGNGHLKREDVEALIKGETAQLRDSFADAVGRIEDAVNKPVAKRKIIKRVERDEQGFPIKVTEEEQ